MTVHERRSYGGTVGDGDPLSAEVVGSCVMRVERPDLHVEVRTAAKYTCDAANFIVHLELDVRSREHGVIRTLRWDKRIPATAAERQASSGYPAAFASSAMRRISS